MRQVSVLLASALFALASCNTVPRAQPGSPAVAVAATRPAPATIPAATRAAVAVKPAPKVSSAPPNPDDTFILAATASAVTAAPGSHIGITITIINNTNAPQTISIPGYAWWAHSDNPAVTFPSFPRGAGIGPVVTFKPLTLAPGQTFQRDWTATIAPGTPPGELIFHLGIPVQQSRWGTYYWSDDIKITVQSP